jgi:pilus assembly protein CpaF
MYTITVSEKGGQQSTFEFSKPEVTIGRMKGNDIVLPKGNVSKRHSRIFAQDGNFKIIDLESTNGTYVNGRKITGEQAITENDKIYIGDFILQVEAEAQAAAKPPTPPPNFPKQGPGGGLPTPGPGPDRLSGSGPQPKPDRGSMSSGPVPSVPDMPSSNSGPRQPMSSPSRDGGPIDFSGLSSGSGSGNNRPGPGPAPPNGAQSAAHPSAPRLESPGLPKRQEDVTVDRMGDRMMGRPEYSQVSAILATNELESEFDSDFHEAQSDVATVLFENITPQDLPFHYPPTPEDHDRFRQIVENAVNTVSPRVDKNELIELITNECVGLGAVDRYLDDSEVHEIYVNRWDFVLVRKGGNLVRAPRAFSHPQLLLAAAYRLLGPRDVEVFTDEMRFNDGTRVHVILPPLSPEGAAITVRKPPSSHPTLDDLVERSALSQSMAEFLTRSTEAGRSILIAGPTGSGKTTLLSALTQQMPSGARVVAIENGSHLALPDNAVRLEPSVGAGFDPRFLIHSALSMHPQRIVLDECRGAEAYDWVTSAACGTEGSMVTLHGTSAAEALGRLESLCLMGASNLSPRGLREQIARAVHLVVVVNRTQAGDFRVQQITEVQGVDLDAFRLNDVFYFRVEGGDGAYHPTGYVPLFYEDMRHAGIDVDFGIFRE